MVSTNGSALAGLFSTWRGVIVIDVLFTYFFLRASVDTIGGKQSLSNWNGINSVRSQMLGV